MSAVVSENRAVAVMAKIGRYRWTICAFLFFSTTLNYMDRQVLGLLKPTLTAQMHWSEKDFGDIVGYFAFFYALGYVGVGRLIDKIGVKLGLAGAVGFWSFFGAMHSLMTSVPGFKFARASLGLAEGGNFPASIKTISEWFPARERALATGIFNAGSNVGAVAAPILVPIIVHYWGWRPAFVITPILGLTWVILWSLFYKNPRENARLSPAELAFITSDPAPPTVRIPWIKLLGYRGTWANVVGTCMSAPVWWFYLNWAPGFLSQRFHVNLMEAMLPLITIYLMADVGSVGGGWLSSHLIKRGVKPLRARQITFLVCGLCVVPVCLAADVASMWTAVLLIGVAAAAHQGYSANVYTVVSDTVPQNTVSSVVGIGGFCAYMVSMFVSRGIGRFLDATHSDYHLLFVIASSLYLIGLVIMHFVLPKAGSGATPAGVEA